MKRAEDTMYRCKCGRVYGHWGMAVRQCDTCYMRFLKAWGHVPL